MKTYNIIYADPPWHYNSKSIKINGNDWKLLNHYPTMKTEEICTLDIKNILSNDACCFMWVTDSHLEDGLKVMKSWGFKYKTIAFVWVKENKNKKIITNAAPWTIKSCEICLFWTKWAMTKYKLKNNVKQLIIAERTKHSKKPLEAINRINELFWDLPKIELFCRAPQEWWDVWGNEIENTYTIQDKTNIIWIDHSNWVDRTCKVEWEMKDWVLTINKILWMK